MTAKAAASVTVERGIPALFVRRVSKVTITTRKRTIACVSFCIFFLEI